MSLFTSLLPSKYVVITFVALLVVVFGMYQQIRIQKAELATITQELVQAREHIKEQQVIVETMKRDHKIELELVEKTQKVIEIIRQNTVIELIEISNTDFGKEANSNAAELEKIINERTKKLLDSITNISRGGK